MKTIISALFFVTIATSQLGFAKDINAGPIWNNADAHNKCPSVCSSLGRDWTGNWVTTVPGRMSVCGCSNDVKAGPIWNNEDANNKCPGVCGAQGDHWNGNWVTTVPNEMSVCGCE